MESVADQLIPAIYMTYLSRMKALTLLFFLTSLSFAHTTGGALELYHGVQGSYEVWVSSRRSAPVTGTHHLKITVLNAQTKQIVPNAGVKLTLVSPKGASKSYAAPSVRAYAFEVDAPLEQAGRWRMSLSVQRASGVETITFSRRILTPLQLWLFPLLAFTASTGLLALLGFGKFNFRSGRRKRPASQRQPTEGKPDKRRSAPTS